MNKDYLGHPSQCYGVEEHRLVGGKGDGLKLLEVRNGRGLEYTISADRCADISRLSFEGHNFGFFSPCGYVSPQYYDKSPAGFPKSFTAGFLTTCGLTAVGTPCIDDGQELPMHGTISNTPVEQIYHTIDAENIKIHAVIRDAQIFGHKLVLEREIVCPLHENVLRITDTVSNAGDTVSPLMLLYHFNMGYPLLDENAILHIASNEVTARDDRAKEGIAEWSQITRPQKQFQEQCYFHRFDEKGHVGLFQPAFEKGVALAFDTAELDCFTQWKMMGCVDYALGLEPGNCLPTGRNAMRKAGILKQIKPGEEQIFHISIRIIENRTQWDQYTCTC